MSRNLRNDWFSCLLFRYTTNHKLKKYKNTKIQKYKNKSLFKLKELDCKIFF